MWILASFIYLVGVGYFSITRTLYDRNKTPYDYPVIILWPIFVVMFGIYYINDKFVGKF